MDQGMKVYKAKDLVYSAYKRCRCGAGLAFPRGCKDPYYFWACGFLLTTDIKYRPVSSSMNPFDAGILEDERGVMHDSAFSFVFHEICHEKLNGTDIATTRDEELVPVKVKKPRKAK